MKSKMSRREFLKYFGKSAAALSMANLLGPAISLSQAATGSGTKRFVVYVYLAGGFDGEAFFPQINGESTSYLRETLRPTITPSESLLLKPYGSSALVGLHSKFSRLLNEAPGKLAVVQGTGMTSMDPGRSHETCSKFLSLGNLDLPRESGKGALAELSDEKNWDSCQLFGIGNPGLKSNFRTDEVAPLIVSNFSDFRFSGRNAGNITACGGTCVTSVPGENLQLMNTVRELNDGYQISKEFEQQYQNTLQALDDNIELVSNQISSVIPTGIYGTTEAMGNSSLTAFQKCCQNAERLIRYLDENSDKDTFVVHLTLGGLDTHANQITTLDKVVADISGGLAGLAQGLKAASNLWNRTTFVVTSEFGRTVRQNGTSTAGTDHGFASKTLVGGGSVRGKAIGEAWALADIQAKNFFQPKISVFHPLVEVLQWAGASGLTMNRGAKGPIFKDGSYNLNASLGLFS